METQALLHTVPVALKMLSIGRTTFYKLVDAGEIRLVKIGNKSLVADSNIRDLVNSKLQAAA